MKKQLIYTMLTAVLAAVSVMQVHAQTGESNVSEARIRQLLSADGTKNTEIKFNAGAVNRVQTLSINRKHEVSPNSPQELRALIFENYTPAVPKSETLRTMKTTLVSRGSGAETLPSESSADETAETMKAEASPAQTPPTQGDVKEEQ